MQLPWALAIVGTVIAQEESNTILRGGLDKAHRQMGLFSSSSAASSDTSSSSGDGCTTTNCGCSWRRLVQGLNEDEYDDTDKVREDLTLSDIHSIIESMKNSGASYDATFFQRHNLISKESCDTLVKYVEESLAHHRASGTPLQAGHHDPNDMESYETYDKEDHYSTKLFAEDLVKTIGAEEKRRFRSKSRTF